MILIYLLVYGIASGVTCGYVASEKNRSTGAWFFLGFLFGVFAMFAIAGVPKRDPMRWDDPAPARPVGSDELREAISHVPLMSEEENAAALQKLIDEAAKPKQSE